MINLGFLITLKNTVKIKGFSETDVLTFRGAINYVKSKKNFIGHNQISLSEHISTVFDKNKSCKSINSLVCFYNLYFDIDLNLITAPEIIAFEKVVNTDIKDQDSLHYCKYFVKTYLLIKLKGEAMKKEPMKNVKAKMPAKNDDMSSKIKDKRDAMKKPMDSDDKKDDVKKRIAKKY